AGADCRRSWARVERLPDVVWRDDAAEPALFAALSAVFRAGPVVPVAARAGDADRPGGRRGRGRLAGAWRRQPGAAGRTRAGTCSGRRPAAVGSAGSA